MIYNKTKKKTIVKKTKFARTFAEKVFGLMFKRKIDYGLVFIFSMEKKHAFHTFFMRFPIDFVFLDKQKRVTEIMHNVHPWKSNTFGYGKYVIELESGKAKEISIRDKISFK